MEKMLENGDESHRSGTLCQAANVFLGFLDKLLAP